MNIVDIKYYIKYYKENFFPYRRCAILNLTYSDEPIICQQYDCNYCYNLIRKYTR